jgi:hypothetical protein
VANTNTGDALLAAYANQVAQTLLADQVGTVAAIPNSLASGELNTAIIVDAKRIEAYKESIADQMNAQSGGPTFTDLSERVARIVINTTAQGASTLEVSIIDPAFVLFVVPDKNGNPFIQADELGRLYPPIDINFPTDTDMVWRLCQVRFTNDLTGANFTLTGEDRPVSLLRDRGPGTGGIRTGQPNQTLGGFIKELVDDTNKAFKPNPPIRLLELIDPLDPNYTVPITQVPKSAAIGTLRKNPNRDKQGLTATQQAALNQIQANVLKFFQDNPATTIREAEPYAGQLANTTAAQSGSADYVPNSSFIPGVDTNP